MPGRQKAKACSVAISLPDGWFSHVNTDENPWDDPGRQLLPGDHWLMKLFFVQHEIYCIPSMHVGLQKTTRVNSIQLP